MPVMSARERAILDQRKRELGALIDTWFAMEAGNTLRKAVTPSSTPEDSVDMVWKEVQIRINCLLIKDYQQTILFRGKCRSPQLQVHTARYTLPLPQVSETDFHFEESDFEAPRSTVRRNSGQSTLQTLVVANIDEAEQTFSIRNNTQFFFVENAAPGSGSPSSEPEPTDDARSSPVGVRRP